MMMHEYDEQNSLVLAAEDCPPELFEKIHTFSTFERKLVRSLVAHGPVLLRGGRGSGKSALLIEADRRLNRDGMAFGVYLSLRYLPLLRSAGRDYEEIFCGLLLRAVNAKLKQQGHEPLGDIATPVDAGTVREKLSDLSVRLGKRIVLFFDDAAHIGREQALTEFFDIFRMISSNLISCKAAIYPGVTKFGIRFDVFNDATVLDVVRDERSPDFAAFFDTVFDTRFPDLSQRLQATKHLPKASVAAFLGRTVVGNMRAFVFACNELSEEEKFGLPELKRVLVKLASHYYWPLLDEVAPKLGLYEPLIEPCRTMAEEIFQYAGSSNVTSLVIHRDIVQRLTKLFEILEYAGFISRREASRAMKSGGRGPRYSLNLACVLELTPKTQLTQDFFNSWRESLTDFAEIHTSSNLIKVELPALAEEADLSVFGLSIEVLAKSNSYPYGLTKGKIEALKANGYQTVGEISDATDEILLTISGVGEHTVKRIRGVLAQAIWM